MPELQTKVQIPNPNFQISYRDISCFFGSCFSMNIGNRFSELKFKTCVNPFGVLYNPASIAQSIRLIIEKTEFSETDLNFYDNKWFSYYHYTSFSNEDKNTCLININNSLQEAKKSLKEASFVFITLGTSFVYKLKSTGDIVANCHKIPAKEFKREFLSSSDSFSFLSEAIINLREINPKLNIIFTISPIRHWKDGAIENMRSKASLILTIHELQKKIPELYYFPVYEIFMDEMRDYRYYASDMLHPSTFAIDYIWDKFYNTFFTKETQLLVRKIEKINKSLQHKPVNPHSQQYKNFKKHLRKQMQDFNKQYPIIDFSADISALSD